jgi:hypothetical protein
MFLTVIVCSALDNLSGLCQLAISYYAQHDNVFFNIFQTYIFCIDKVRV